MAGSRKNSDTRGPRKGSAPTGAVAKAAKPAGVPKSSSSTRTTRAFANQTTSTSTNQPAPTNQTAPTNQPQSQPQTQPQPQASAPRRRGTLTADVLAHPSGFGYADPEALMKQARDAKRAANTNNRPRRPPVAKGAGRKKPTRGSGRRRPAAAAPAAPAPVAQPPQPAEQPPHTNAELEGNGEPANDETAPTNDAVDNEPIPVDDAAANDLTPEQEAEKEAAEVQAAILEASAAEDQAAKERAEKEEAAKKKREAAEREREAKLKELKEQAERDEAARIAQEEADRNKAGEEAARQRAAEKKAAQEQKDAEEAARKEAVRQEAAKKEAAEKEAAVKEEAAKLKAAQEQAERDEAARKQAEEEAAREEAAQQQKIAEEAARQKAAKQKADQEKAAAEAKLAQEKEQAAKQKATQDEAAIIKAADNVAAFRKAEEEAKVEKLRLAKEQKDKEEAELLAKEARGLKRPGVKRAAPQTADQANKKAKTEDCKPSCEPFQTDLKFARFKFGKTAIKNPDGPVKFGSHLSLDVIFQALASVTEAINDTCVKEKQAKLWGIFHPRSLVDFNIVDHPVVLQRHDALVPIDRSAGKKTHFSLVALVQTQVASIHGRDFFDIHHYDCDPSLRQAFINTSARTLVRSRILSAGWAGSGKGDVETPLGKSENRDCCDRLPGTDQEWTTGLHAILNGWVCALALKHNKNALLTKEGFYEKAVDLINLAIRGHVRSRMILDFFDCYEYVLKDDLPEDTRQRRTFTETKDFETYARLDKHILSLLGRKPAVDVDEVTGSTIKRTEAKETPLGSGRRTGDYAPSNLDAFMRGAEGPVGLPEEEGEVVKPEQAPVNDHDDDSARSEDDDDYVGDEDEDGEVKAAVDDKEKVVEEPEQQFDFRGKVITPESRAAEAAARAAAKEKMEREKREREEKEAAAAAAARAKSAEPEDSTNSLFGDDDDEDINDFYNNDAPPPTSAPQDDPEEDLYSSSRSPRRQPQPQPALQPTAVDDEEDLYGVSPPRNGNPPPVAPAAASTLHLPGAPPPTPHDPYVVNGSPFLFPTMYDQPPPPPVSKSSSNVSPGKSTNGLRLPSPAPEPTSRRNPGFRVPSLSLSPEAKLKTPSNLSPGKTTNGLALPPPPPTTGRNPGFRVPSKSLSPEANIKTPSNQVLVAEDVEAPATRRPIVNPNPHGTFEVPDTGSDSSEGHNDNANAAGEQNGTAQRKAAQQTTTAQAADTPRGAAQTNGTTSNKPTTQPAAAHPTAPELDAEEAWATAGWFNKAPPSPSLEAAMAEYDHNDDETPGPEAAEYDVDGWRADDQNEYHMEVQALHSGEYDSEPDDGMEVRQVLGDDVRYGEVEVEEREDGFEIDYGYAR